MAETSIYGEFTETLLELKKRLELEILAWNEEAVREGKHKCFEHLTSRLKTEASMREKLKRRGLTDALCRRHLPRERKARGTARCGNRRGKGLYSECKAERLSEFTFDFAL